MQTTQRAPLYILERVPNLKFFQLWIFLQKECYPKIHLFPNRILVLNDNSSILLDIPVKGGLINTSQASVNLLPSIIDVKMPSSHMFDEIIQDEKINVQDLQKIFCNYCGTSIIAEKNMEQVFQKVSALPSQNWMELTEMWFCNCGHEHKTAQNVDEMVLDDNDNEFKGKKQKIHHHDSPKFFNFPIERIIAKEGVCLIGDTFIMIHKNNLNLSNLQVPKGINICMSLDGKIPYSWISLNCVKCNQQLGSVEVEDSTVSQFQSNYPLSGSIDAISNSKTFRFFKHRISSSLDISQNLFRSFSIEQVLANEIFRISQSSKIYKFIIENEQHKPFLRLQLTNWETWITTNAFAEEFGVIFPILKILFVECLNEESNLQGIEVIRYSQIECEKIVKILHSNHELIPPQRRHFNQMKVSFIRRK